MKPNGTGPTDLPTLYKPMVESPGPILIGHDNSE